LPGGEILDTSQGATKMFGYSNEEFKRLKRQDIIDETDPAFALAIQARDREGYVTGKPQLLRRTANISRLISHLLFY